MNLPSLDKESDNGTSSKKERRLKRQRDNGLQTDEDLFEADGDKIQHGGSTIWQEEVNKKLDSLLRLIPLVEDLKEDLKKLKEENESLRTSLTWATEEINHLRKHQANTEEELKAMKEQVIDANQELDLLQRRSIKLEAQSRRNNIKVFNVKETETMDSFKGTESVLKKLLVDQLKMPKEEVADLEFERVHRIPTCRSDENDRKKPRPIIAKMSFYKDKSRIFKYVKNIDRSTKIGVADDFPKEIEKIRKTLFLVLKDAKKKNDKAELNVDKLIIITDVSIGDQKPLTYHFTQGSSLPKSLLWNGNRSLCERFLDDAREAVQGLRKRFEV